MAGYGTDSYGNPFGTQQQADAYSQAQQARDANLNSWQQNWSPGTANAGFNPNAQDMNAAIYGGYNSQAYQNMLGQAGNQANMNKYINQFSAGGTGYDPNAAAAAYQQYNGAGAGGGSGGGGGGGAGGGGGGGMTGSNPFNFGQNDGYQFGQQTGGYMDPSYDWRLQQGEKALQGSAAARGGLLSGATLKGINDYAGNAASQEYSNAYNRFNQDRAFNYGVDNNDRNFAYNAQQNDQNFNYGTLRDMMNYGMQGTQGQAGVNSLLATLLSQNALAAGQAQGAGGVGQGNTISNMISQLMQQYNSNNMLTRFGY